MRPAARAQYIDPAAAPWQFALGVLCLGLAAPAAAAATTAPSPSPLPIEIIAMVAAFTVGAGVGALLSVRPSWGYWVLPLCAVGLFVHPAWHGQAPFVIAAALMGGILGAVLWPGLQARWGALALLAVPIAPMLLGLLGTRLGTGSFFATLAGMFASALILWWVWPRRATDPEAPGEVVGEVLDGTADTIVDVVVSVISEAGGSD
jgi:hypothetical protein